MNNSSISQNSLLTAASYDDASKLKSYGTTHHNSCTEESSLKKTSSPRKALTNATLIEQGVASIIDWLHEDAALNHKYTIAAFVRKSLFDPTKHRQSFHQRTGMSVLLGVVSGIYVGLWKLVIEVGMDFIWETLPERLAEVAPESVRNFYLPTIMSFGCGVVATGFELCQGCPDQNSLIEDLYTTGKTCYRHPLSVLVLATIAMWAGLPLGPELPLLLVAAMFGSWAATQLDLDQDESTVLYLSTQGAAIGGFFKYPIGGALFPLEVPQQTGLAHASALSPTLVASIASTVVCCGITNSPLGSLFSISGTPGELSFYMLWLAAAVSMVGTGIGLVYAAAVKYLKTEVHNMLEAPHARATQSTHSRQLPADACFFDKAIALRQAELQRRKRRFTSVFRQFVKFSLVGLVVAAVVTVFPHNFSWGEAQVQSMMDGGTTDLPFFGEDSPLLTEFATCMPGSDGVSIGCMLVIPVAKMVIIGLVLATGIRCGHFWGPAFVSASVGQAVVSCAGLIWSQSTLAPYEGIIRLCLMASVHVVTFRSPLGITFILAQSMGPSMQLLAALILASVVSFHLSYGTFFYKAQRNLCPGELAANGNTSTRSCSSSGIDEASCSYSGFDSSSSLDFDSSVDV